MLDQEEVRAEESQNPPARTKTEMIQIQHPKTVEAGRIRGGSDPKTRSNRPGDLAVRMLDQDWLYRWFQLPHKLCSVGEQQSLPKVE